MPIFCFEIKPTVIVARKVLSNQNKDMKITCVNSIVRKSSSYFYQKTFLQNH